MATTGPIPGAPTTSQVNLSDWLDAHDPKGRQPYAPSDTYCTKYVEDAIVKATGFDLYGAVTNDMNGHAPGPHLTGTMNDGYRFSSPFSGNAAADPYDSDNVAKYFQNKHELHAFAGNHGMQTGDVLFFHGGDEAGLDHTAMVAKVDGQGRATEIAESTGKKTKYVDWNTFEADYEAEGKTLVSFGRPTWSQDR